MSNFVPPVQFTPPAQQVPTDAPASAPKAVQYVKPTIQSVFSLTEQNGVKIMVYGKAGMGKTRLLSTAKMPLILSAEKGLLSLRKRIREIREQTNNPYFDLPAIEVATVEDLKNVHTYLTTDPQAREMFLTIGLDSVTEIAEVTIANALRTNKDGRKAYGELYTDVVETIRLYRDLSGYHVVFIAQEETEKDGATGALYRTAKFPGQRLSGATLYQFDEVFHAHRGIDAATQAEYWALATAPTPYVEAKDRSGMLAPIEYPDLDYLIGKIMQA